MTIGPGRVVELGRTDDGSKRKKTWDNFYSDPDLWVTVYPQMGLSQMGLSLGSSVLS